MSKYQEYIKALGLTQRTAYGKCREVCDEMLKHFPELKLVGGYIYDASWGQRGHWWLVDEQGTIIDPTLIQFPCPSGIYDAFGEDNPQPTGMCPNCGEYCYDGEYVHEKCAASYAAYCSSGI